MLDDVLDAQLARRNAGDDIVKAVGVIPVKAKGRVCLRIKVDQQALTAVGRQRGDKIDRRGCLAASAFLVRDRNDLHGTLPS